MFEKFGMGWDGIDIPDDIFKLQVKLLVQHYWDYWVLDTVGLQNSEQWLHLRSPGHSLLSTNYLGSSV